MPCLRMLPPCGIPVHHPAPPVSPQLCLRKVSPSQPLLACVPISRLRLLRCQAPSPFERFLRDKKPPSLSDSPSSPTHRRVYGSLFKHAPPWAHSVLPSSSRPPPPTRGFRGYLISALMLLFSLAFSSVVDSTNSVSLALVFYVCLFFGYITAYASPSSALSNVLSTMFVWGCVALASLDAPVPLSLKIFGYCCDLYLLGLAAPSALERVCDFWKARAPQDAGEEAKGEPRFSIVRLQVGLMGTAKQLQKELERMATEAKTWSAAGLQDALQESVLSLLRSPEHSLYGYSTSEVAWELEEGEGKFMKLSLEERSKFKLDAMVSKGDDKEGLEKLGEFVEPEFFVVTIHAACEGSFQLPKIMTAEHLRSALLQLGTLTATRIQAVEILWTPSNEEEMLTTKDMLQDYPLLRPL